MDTSVPHPRVSGLEASDSALFATLIKEAPIGFAFFDTELKCQRVNETLAGIRGVPTRDLIGRRPSEGLPAELATAMEAALRKVLEEDQSVLDADLIIEMPTGEDKDLPPETRHWSSSWFPSHSAEGKILGVALIAVDVTDRRRAEDVIRRKEERYRSP